MPFNHKSIVTLIAIVCILAGCEKTAPSKFNYDLRVAQPQVENEIVHAYMAEVTYTNGDYTYSRIKPYYDSEEYSSPTKFAPRQIIIKWNPNPAKYSGQTITITDDEGFTDECHAASYGSTRSIYNLIPGKKYRAVLKGFNPNTHKTDSLTSITFSPEGQVRMINVPGINNVRDMGGWKSAVYKHEDGSPMTIRYGRLYRGGELDRKQTLSASSRDILLKDLKIGADADFRNSTECANISCSALGADIPYQRISTSMYASSASSDTHARDFKWILERLREGKNVYYHCVAGADRTGTMGYLMEGVLGVCENDQCKDWELTCFYSWRSRVYGEKYDFGTMIKTYFETYKGETTADNCVAYFKKYGITDEELEEFRSIMLE